MPVWLASIGGVLINAARPAIVQMLIALGISVVTYQGMDISVTWLKTQALNSIHGLPADMVSLIAYLGVGQCINIIFSAIVMRMTWQGISGTVKRFKKG